MKLSELQNTNDEQFLKNITFPAKLPTDDGAGQETELMLTVKSARNPEVKGRLNILLNESHKESKKLENPNITDEQAKVVSDKVKQIEVKIAKLMLVSFSGLTDDEDKPVKSTQATIDDLVNNYGWVRSNIVTKASSEQAFFTN